MKTTNLVLVFLAIASIMLAWLYFDSRHNCQSCEQGQQNLRVLNKKYDFSLKVDCTKDNTYQPFQYDLANGYSIMGKLKLDSVDVTLIKKIDFELYEAGDCVRYGIDTVTHQSYDGNHIFEFQIEPLGDTNSNSFEIKKDLYFKANQAIFPKIVSEDLPSLETDFPPASTNYAPDELEGFVRQFPPFICPALIYDGSNN